MTLTRTKLLRCRVKDCPWPDDEEIHRCWGEFPHGCDGSATHQHHPKKGMGGRNSASRIVAILCQTLHQDVDQNGVYRNEVCLIDGRKFYRLWRPGEDYRPEGWALILRELPAWL